MSGECPAGGPRCPEWLCDCFSYQFPDQPEEWGKLHPELFEVLPPDRTTDPEPRA